MISIRVDAAINPGYNHQFINFTRAGEWYYARVNGVTAPTTAGRYFFKMFLYGGSDTYGVGPTLPGTSPISPRQPGELPDMWVPPQNWPVLLVKGEVDPSIITGTIRYGGYNSTLYGEPIGEAGRIWAKMETKLDPYTGSTIATCPAESSPGQSQVVGCTDAIGYWNNTAQGHYEVEGVASGIYTIYAEAAGYPQSIIESNVTILKGQSLHFDGYLQPGPVIHGNVFSKHQFGDEPWSENSYIKIELYDAPTLSNIPSPNANLVSWSPLPCIAGGQEQYYGGTHAANCGDPRMGSLIAFPWHEYSTVCADIPASSCPYSSTTFLTGQVNVYTRDVSE